MALGKVPERIRLAVLAVDPRPGEQILEIGCGPGVAAALVADRLDDAGHLVALDRSATAIGRAMTRNASSSDRVTFVETSLDAYEPDREFDKAFAVNVNVFWTTAADTELDLVRRCLRTGGTLHLCYEAPGGRPSERMVNRVVAALTRHDFLVSVRSKPLLTFTGTV
jgi:trans-aconitate methyltransferase